MPVSANQAQDAEAERHFARLSYSIYTAPPLHSLSLLRSLDWSGAPSSISAQLPLLEAGLALQYGMPTYAQQLLAASSASSNPLALYWRAHIALSQRQDSLGLEEYQRLTQVVEEAPSAKAIGLTPEQWWDIHYLAASASQRQGDYQYPAQSLLPSTHIGQAYLMYNQALNLYQPQAPLDAMLLLKEVAARLSSHHDPEGQALKHQVLLTLGQWQLDDGRINEAMSTLGMIDGPSLQRDEALLHFGWSLARKRDWPMAMGVWQVLSQKGESLFALQALHALALGYAEQGGDVQAYQQLDKLITALALSSHSLGQLEGQLQRGQFWSAGLQQQDALRQWPTQHADLLVQLLTVEQAENYQGLNQLYSVQSQLDEQQQRLQALLVVLEQRQQRLEKRLQQQAVAQVSETMRALQQTELALASQLAEVETHHQDDNETLRVKALLSLATEPQRSAWQRLMQAQKRMQRLSEEAALSDDYAPRLARIKAALLWQMSEHAVTASWEVKRAWEQVETLSSQAQRQVNRVERLGAGQHPIAAQQQQVQGQIVQVQRYKEQVDRLTARAETSLSEQALALIRTRQEELQQQQYRARLAMLQLKDRWRGNDE